MAITIDINIMCDQHWIPTPALFKQWSEATLEGLLEHAEISVCVVDLKTIQQLNHDYRGQDKPTNVLSFPQDNNFLPDGTFPIGDIVICSTVLENEAKAQNKTIEAYWAHMTIHSILHLMGMDHLDPIEADKMEALETQILHKLGYPAPYGDTP